MEQTVSIYLDDKPVRFTQDGRVFILDAIRALIGSEHSERILCPVLENKYQYKGRILQ